MEENLLMLSWKCQQFRSIIWNIYLNYNIRNMMSAMTSSLIFGKRLFYRIPILKFPKSVFRMPNALLSLICSWQRVLFQTDVKCRQMEYLIPTFSWLRLLIWLWPILQMGVLSMLNWLSEMHFSNKNRMDCILINHWLTVELFLLHMAISCTWQQPIIYWLEIPTSVKRYFPAWRKR